MASGVKADLGRNPVPGLKRGMTLEIPFHLQAPRFFLLKRDTHTFKIVVSICNNFVGQL